MPLPDPQPGLVISYAYLWDDEHQRGQEEGLKDRPCAIVLARQIADGVTVVTVVPITHSPPSDPDAAIEIPPATKARLGLDHLRSWIIASEVNDFVWPGPDIRPLPAVTPTAYDYGFLPPALFNELKALIIEKSRSRTVHIVARTK